jgi:hypothetical protein
MCFGEWEEVSPWPSLAEQRGFAATDDVVHAHAGMGTVPLCDNRFDDARERAYLLARSIAYPASNKMLGSITMQRNGHVVLAINPDWAAQFGRQWPDVDDFRQFVHENAWQPIELWPESHRELWEDRADSRGRVHLNESPEQLFVIVCGGPVALHAVFLPSWGETVMESQVVHHV